MNKFVVVYNNDIVRAVSETVVSTMYDLADCDYMEEVREIYSVDEKGKLVPVRVGEQKRYEASEEHDVYYASAPIYAGERTVGFVHFSNH